MAKISNNTILREILTELKELKAILHRPLSNMEIGEKKTSEIPRRKCQECGNETIESKGILEVDKFYCLPCWKVKMEKEMIAEVQQEKKETKIPEQPNSFKDFAENMNKVECVECKSKVSLAECNYDPARNRYTCHPCDKKLKEAKRARKEAETREQIKNLEGGIK